MCTYTVQRANSGAAQPMPTGPPSTARARPAGSAPATAAAADTCTPRATKLQITKKITPNSGGARARPPTPSRCGRRPAQNNHVSCACPPRMEAAGRLAAASRAHCRNGSAASQQRASLPASTRQQRGRPAWAPPHRPLPSSCTLAAPHLPPSCPLPPPHQLKFRVLHHAHFAAAGYVLLQGGKGEQGGSIGSR